MHANRKPAMQGAQSAGLSASAERRIEADKYQYDHGRSDGVVAAGEPHNSHHPTLTASHSHSTSSSSANPFAPLHSPLATAAGPSTFSQATSRLYAPRRNHTISSPGRSALNSRRLAQHFEVPEAATTPPALSQQDAEPATPTSPGTNSLKAIMGAADDDHDWERMIRNNAPLPDDVSSALASRRVQLAASASAWLGSLGLSEKNLRIYRSLLLLREPSADTLVLFITLSQRHLLGSVTKGGLWARRT